MVSQRPRRQSRIVELIRSRSIASQDQLRELLGRSGFEVTQATLSRDLRALGVVKGAEGYLLPAGVSAIEASAPLSQMLAMFAMSVRVAGSLVVVRTGPGQAQVVALGLDRGEEGEVIGTIAGDDTIFIATAGAREARALAERLREMAGMGS